MDKSLEGNHERVKPFFKGIAQAFDEFPVAARYVIKVEYGPVLGKKSVGGFLRIKGHPFGRIVLTPDGSRQGSLSLWDTGIHESIHALQVAFEYWNPVVTDKKVFGDAFKSLGIRSNSAEAWKLKEQFMTLKNADEYDDPSEQLAYILAGGMTGIDSELYAALMISLRRIFS